MSKNAQIRPLLGLTCATILVASGCTGTAREPSAAVTPHRTTAAAAAPTSTATPKPATADPRACAGVEAIIGHITVDTARWSPRRNPFDAAISTRLAVQSRNLAAQGQAATDRGVRRAVRTTAASFNDVARAMTTKKRSQLNRAIRQSRVAYKQLKRVCALGDTAK